MADAAGLPDFTLLHKTKGRGRGGGLHLCAFDICWLYDVFGKSKHPLPRVKKEQVQT